MAHMWISCTQLGQCAYNIIICCADFCIAKKGLYTKIDFHKLPKLAFVYY